MIENGLKRPSLNTNALVCVCHGCLSIFYGISPFNISLPTRCHHLLLPPCHQIYTVGCNVSSDWLGLNSKTQGLNLIGWRLEAGGGGAEGIEGKGRREMWFFFLKGCERSPLSICNHKIVGAGIKLWIREKWIMTAWGHLDINDLHLWFLIFFRSLVDHLCGRLSLKEMDWWFSVAAFTG